MGRHGINRKIHDLKQSAERGRAAMNHLVDAEKFMIRNKAPREGGQP